MQYRIGHDCVKQNQGLWRGEQEPGPLPRDCAWQDGSLIFAKAHIYRSPDCRALCKKADLPEWAFHMRASENPGSTVCRPLNGGACHSANRRFIGKDRSRLAAVPCPGSDTLSRRSYDRQRVRKTAYLRVLGPRTTLNREMTTVSTCLLRTVCANPAATKI